MLESKEQKEIIRDIARKKNRDIDVIRKIVYSQFKYSAYCIKNKKDYRIAFFGLFKLNEKKQERIIKYSNKDEQF